ncbi:polysaccharide deacetylase family protein [Halalkalibacter nanhaiisediminis]|uniref:Peptidoglycan/xylan/chitin deacetylase (PgdA/CDA1 family) n=1 Tax=Halalkalibacter nanhaiisediminis TaxID=688079 RepID=A0A562QQV7_9BACI|nr:polysaccharide deacetylase family protein [Halalkalibacter nanhaiisediminis]TWI59114.1 peptidoglycan/xylan/chitin deacetylase (PgdA/CDA1 family) [Halalkalibacter nanhaiisediminis]
MRREILKMLLMSVLLFCVFVNGNTTVLAEEESIGDHLLELWGSKDKKDQPQQREQEIPDPAGGPEYSGRVRQPVSNIILQQKYPNTVVLRGPLTENKVALTFDDGPDPRFTNQVLDVLKEFNVPATFFVLGKRAETYPDIVRRMVKEGHIIGNHTYSHTDLSKAADIETLVREVNQTEDVLVNLIGYRPKLFRAPYGFLYDELVEKLAEMNYTVVGWSADSLDWRELPPEDIAYNVLSNVEPGAIILMHDGGEQEADRTGTIKALRQIIPTLKEQGFEFVTVPDLVNIPYQK